MPSLKRARLTYPHALLVAVVAAALLLAPPAATGQSATLTTPAAHSATAHATTGPRHKRHPRHSKKARPEMPATVSQAAPQPPPAPADQSPSAAVVSFANGMLTIQARNSSLEQILNQVSQQTGMEIEGSNHDKRIYGDYGPGTVSATVEKLLNGAGYNYVIVGGGNGRPPAKLLLTSGSAGTSSAPPASSPAPQASTPVQSAAPENPSNPVHPKTPQEIFEELRRMHQH
jgi:hypothetical protein